jgi:GxxExxY protein
MADQDRERLFSESGQANEMISRRGAGAQRIIENKIGTRVIEAAIEVHRELGPGLLESVYEAVLASELTGRGLKVARQVPVAIEYKGITFDEGFRADLIVEDRVILELTSVEHVAPAHKKQVQTYLKLTGCKLGYLLNFGEAVLRTGITRYVNGLEENPLCASAPLREKRPDFQPPADM